MKTTICVAILGTLLAVTGCVKTVSGGKTAGVPFVRDTFTGHYQRPVEQVFQASKDVLKDMGSIATESIVYNQSNLSSQSVPVKTLQGAVNGTKVWIRVEAVDAQMTTVAVQTRTKSGGTDADLTHEIEKQIAVKLASR
jgi:hypothetical protein